MNWWRFLYFLSLKAAADSKPVSKSYACFVWICHSDIMDAVVWWLQWFEPVLLCPNRLFGVFIPVPLCLFLGPRDSFRIEIYFPCMFICWGSSIHSHIWQYVDLYHLIIILVCLISSSLSVYIPPILQSKYSVFYHCLFLFVVFLFECPSVFCWTLMCVPGLVPNYSCSSSKVPLQVLVVFFLRYIVQRSIIPKYMILFFVWMRMFCWYKIVVSWPIETERGFDTHIALFWWVFWFECCLAYTTLLPCYAVSL